MSARGGISSEQDFPHQGFAVHASLITSCVGLAGYIMFQSIPGTGALRSLFLLLILGGLLGYSRLARPALGWPALDMAGKTLLLLSAWLAFQSGFLAVDGFIPLKTFAVEWPKNLLIAAIGIWLARAASFARKGEWVFVATFCGFFAHVLGTWGYQAWRVLALGKIEFGMSLLGNYGYVAPLVEGTIVIALADAAGRVCFNRPLLPLPPTAVGGVFFLALFALVALTAKTSWLVVLLMLGLFSAVTTIFKRRYRKRIFAASLAAALCVIALGTLVHGRWNGALESIRYGQAVEAHTAWKGTGEPLPSHIDESFYLRTAWGIVGLRGLAEHPLGRGYGSDAFGRYLNEKYGIHGAVSSHSGWLDFALANGIPGLVLLLIFSATLCIHSWKSFVSHTGIGGLTLAFLTIAYVFRCLIDGHFTTSRLMAFFLVSGVLWGLTRDADPPRESRSA